MRILQVGGGSMGSRRMRDLHGRRFGDDAVDVRLWDGRADRRAAALERFGVASFDGIEEAMAWQPQAMVVSTPPDQHAELVEMAVRAGVHVFSEADIWPAASEIARAADQAGVVAAPSATLLFQPVVREVGRIVATELGTVHAFGYLLSVDAPAWHPGEGDEYYARHRATAPAREMTAFELIALQRLVGHASSVAGVVTTRGSLDHEGDDTYCLQYRTTTGAVGQLTVLMACPQVVRQGWIAGTAGLLSFDLLAGTVRRQFPATNVFDDRVICDWAATLESVYLDEITAFLGAVAGTAPWPYSLHDSALVCGTLAAAEISSRSGRAEPVLADVPPDPVADGYRTPAAAKP
jgi:predicted dehydrogenase